MAPEAHVTRPTASVHSAPDAEAKSAEEKIKIVLAGLRGEDSIAELSRQEGIALGMYQSWSMVFLEAGRPRSITTLPSHRVTLLEIPIMGRLAVSSLLQFSARGCTSMKGTMGSPVVLGATMPHPFCIYIYNRDDAGRCL